MSKGTQESCKCRECKGACESRPCWPTPADVRKLLASKFKDRLMLDWWVGDEDLPEILILSPALDGCENEWAPERPTGVCTFFDNKGLCELHKPGLKPTEAKLCMCTDSGEVVSGRHKRMAMSWNNEKAKKLVSKWLKDRDLTEADKPEDDVFGMLAGMLGGFGF